MSIDSMRKLSISRFHLGQASKPMSLISLLRAFKETQLSQEVRDWVGDELQNYAKVAQTTTRVRDLQCDLTCDVTYGDMEDCNCATSRWRAGGLATVHTTLSRSCWRSCLLWLDHLWLCTVTLLQIEELAVNIKEQSQLRGWYV